MRPPVGAATATRAPSRPSPPTRSLPGARTTTRATWCRPARARTAAPPRSRARAAAPSATRAISASLITRRRQRGHASRRTASRGSPRRTCGSAGGRRAPSRSPARSRSPRRSHAARWRGGRRRSGSASPPGKDTSPGWRDRSAARSVNTSAGTSPRRRARARRPADPPAPAEAEGPRPGGARRRGRCRTPLHRTGRRREAFGRVVASPDAHGARRRSPGGRPGRGPRTSRDRCSPRPRRTPVARRTRPPRSRSGSSNGIGAAPEIVRGAAGRPSVVATLGDGDGPTLAWNGHLDTVPAGSLDTWRADPFGGEVVDGRLIGRGACDMKGPIAAALAAAAAVRRAGIDGPGRVTFHLAADEELAGVHGTKVLWERGLLTQGAAIVGEPSDLQLGLAERGGAWITATAHGKASHGSQPDRGVNAITSMARYLLRLPEVLPDTRAPAVRSTDRQRRAHRGWQRAERGARPVRDRHRSPAAPRRGRSRRGARPVRDACRGHPPRAPGGGRARRDPGLDRRRRGTGGLRGRRGRARRHARRARSDAERRRLHRASPMPASTSTTRASRR